MNLTPNFTIEELYASATASAKHIDNTPSASVVLNLKLLAKNILQPLRDATGPVTVNCGYRCSELNKSVGGVASSQHLTGQAADIETADKKAAFKYIQDHLPFDQLIWENGNNEQPAWIHVSYSAKNRREVLKKVPGGGYVKFKL